METSRNIQRISGKKRKKPKLRFRFGVLLLIFALSFCGCFILYMLAANFNADFFKDEFDTEIVEDDPLIIETDDYSEDTADTPLDAEQATETAEVKKVTNPVPQSAAADSSYYDECCLVTDSTILSISDYTKFKDVLGNWQLSAANCNTAKVESAYGTVTVYEIMKLKKPQNLYLMLGSDLGTSETDDMLSAYTTLIANLHASLPDMNIYIMQLPPVFYDTETKTNELINEYNKELLTLANKAGVYCIDTNTALKSGEGTLAEEYWSTEDLTLSSAAYSKISEYILSHIA